MTNPTPNTSSASSSAYSRGDRFSKHFKKYRNGECHVKAPVNLPGGDKQKKQDSQLIVKSKTHFSLRVFDCDVQGVSLFPISLISTNMIFYFKIL